MATNATTLIHYKIQSSHIIIAYVSYTCTTWFFQTWHWVFQQGGEKQRLEKERLWLLMDEPSSSPPSYVQVSYSSILLTNVLHLNTESFILLFLFLFLKGSSSRQLTLPDSGKGGI